ncbi:hypothetical protein CRG98_041180 [Punica granatum]|uniref:Uncharacterized protein n=1 Tax=Punica granatum TaxID=22663 RepID=A0A2I0I3W4_PUNGR|nr:hypothetical protein CRG98_041180 [Punica granatum]
MARYSASAEDLETVVVRWADCGWGGKERQVGRQCMKKWGEVRKGAKSCRSLKAGGCRVIIKGGAGRKRLHVQVEREIGAIKGIRPGERAEGNFPRAQPNRHSLMELGKYTRARLENYTKCKSTPPNPNGTLGKIPGA